jgi:dTDP-4-dehydrorhamnose reductase
MTADGEATWAEFAEAIFTASEEAGGPSARVNPIGTSDYPTPGRRPVNSRLNCAKLARVHDVWLPHWRTSTREIVKRLVQPAEQIGKLPS